MITFECSGSYSSSTGSVNDVVDFEGLKGVMPSCDEEWINSHVQNRYLPILLKDSKKYVKRFDMMRKCYLDDYKIDDEEPDIIGKDILKMDWKELQDLAVYKHLLEIPLFQATSLRQARQTAYLAYNEKILGKVINRRKDEKVYDRQKIPLDPSDEKFNFMKFPPLLVESNFKEEAAFHEDPDAVIAEQI